MTIVAGVAATATPTDTPVPTPMDTPTPGLPATLPPLNTPTDTPEPTPTDSASLGGIGVLAMVRPAPIELPLLDPDAVTVTVEDTNGDPKEGLPVYVFDGTEYTGYNDITNVSGEVIFDLPEGSYRFRSDLNGTQFWSGETNHCDIPGCSNATVVVTIPVTVTVEDTDGTAKDGLPVYAFDGTTYTGYNGTTDVNGEVMLTLPQGDYRFRSDMNGTHFWSDEINHCTIPGCESATVVVTLPVTVTVTNTDAVPQGGLPVYVFDEATYTGFHGTTDVNGEVSLTLPQGDYRFRSDLNGTQFWSGETNHCTIPSCLSTSITVTIPMTVTVQSQTGSPYPDLPVYAFDGETYTGFNGTSDENGQEVFTLPQGDYRFRSDYDGVQFWSGEVNHCTIPGCLQVLVEIPGGVGEVSVTIDYYYDPLYRLTEADYSTGEYFWYTYDAVGNRLEQETHEETNTYVYDTANRLIEVDGVPFIWDDNGNLIQDDTRIYGYDYANRLTFVLMDGDTYNFSYNGLGDRLRQTVNDIPTIYWLDLNAGLTQVLVSEEATYLYGLARIGEEQPSGWQFYLGDALGSVRQLVDVSNGVGAGMTYEPFGDDLVSTGVANSVYGFTGEWADSYIKLIYLRSRYYQSSFGRFATRDLWSGDIREPTTLHKWMYVADNPINRIDPSGLDPNCPAHRPEYCAWQRLGEIIEGTSGDSFEALFRAFEDRELTERWWLSAGRTSGGRLEWLLRVTRKGLLNIKIPFGDNDCSLNPLFRDQAFYDKEWESWYGGQTSNQVGHFLTAVSSAQWGWTGRRFAIGHEKMSDKPIEGMDSIEHLRRQYQSVTEEDINLWEKAIDADGVGDYDLRDDLLWQILSFEDVARDGVSENRPGNSLQDLRLSLKGFRFNSWIRKIRNYYSQPRRAGIWLRDNLGNWQLTH